MDYTQFRKAVIKRLEEKTKGTGLRVETESVVKGNDTVKEGIMICGGDMSFTPTMYLDDLFSIYCSGQSVAEITEFLLNLRERYEKEGSFYFPDIKSFSDIKDLITFKLVNPAINSRYLKSLIHSDFLDLSLTYHITAIVGEERNVMSARITPDLFEIWNITREELDGLARINTRRILGVYMRELKEFLLDYLEEREDEKCEELKELLRTGEQSPVYLLSNETRRYGAVNILYEDILKDLADRSESDVYIIPSSIHEVLLIPENGKINKKDANLMIGDVNRQVLRPEEILSDHVYLYDRKRELIRM